MPEWYKTQHLGDCLRTDFFFFPLLCITWLLWWQLARLEKQICERGHIDGYGLCQPGQVVGQVPSVNGVLMSLSCGGSW